MDPSMVAEESPKVQLKAPENLHPLAKLGWLIRNNKYKPTPQEGEVLAKCFEDAKWYYMNAPLAVGALVWSFTGGTRLKAFPRVLLTLSAAFVGHDLGGRVGGYTCMKKILSLEDSPLRGELIAILRQNNPNDPLLKSNLVKDEERRPLPVFVTDSDMQDSTLAASNKDSTAGNEDRIASSFGPSGEEDTALRNGEEPRRAPRLWKPEPKEAVTRKESGGADLLADPFDLVMQSGFGDNFAGGTENGVKGRLGKERRRSRMSVKERREYDRQQYQRMQQEQQKVSMYGPDVKL